MVSVFILSISKFSTLEKTCSIQSNPIVLLEIYDTTSGLEGQEKQLFYSYLATEVSINSSAVLVPQNHFHFSLLIFLTVHQSLTNP